MKVISVGKRFEIYDDSLQHFDQLPAKAYSVRYSKETGFYLEEHLPIEINEEKIYGVHTEKIAKVMNSFAITNRSLGVILSGDKGIGKSLFSKMMMIESVNKGMPVIIVDEYIRGIASYIEKIEQESMIMFDEFDKTFVNGDTEDGETNGQIELLSLFDGISQGKKLFVITCNNIYGINEYLINRPGRFHYHFRFQYPSDDQIREYLNDKLNEQFYSEIDSVISLSHKINLNYDCLRAIAFDLNQGTSFRDAIQDLNIINLGGVEYEVTVYCKDGRILTGSDDVDFFDNNLSVIELYCNTLYIGNLRFKPDKLHYDFANKQYILHENDITISSTRDDKIKPDYAVIKKKFNKYSYAL